MKKVPRGQEFEISQKLWTRILHHGKENGKCETSWEETGKRLSIGGLCHGSSVSTKFYKKLGLPFNPTWTEGGPF